MANKSAKNTDTITEQPLLTEEQLLAMPEEDYMNDQQLAFFKDRLKKLEADILNNADATTENLRTNHILWTQ